MPPSIDELKQTGLAWVLNDCYSDPPPYLWESLRRFQEYRAAYPAVTQRQPSLWHATCTHRQYNITCEQYDDLLSRAGFACQLCRRAADRLVIDHDHALGWWAVRGVVCPWCNSHLGRVDGGRTYCDPETAAYLASPPSWRRPFDTAPIYVLATVVGRWERHHKVPEHLRIGDGTNYWMNRAIHLIRTNGTCKPPYRRGR